MRDTGGRRLRAVVRRFVAALGGRRVALIGLLAGVGAAAGWGLWAAGMRWLPLAWPFASQRDAEAVLPGLRIDGERVPAGQTARAFVGSRARTFEGLRVRVHVRADATVLEATAGELGASVDVDAVSTVAMRLGRTQDWLQRALLADAARRGAIDVPLEPRFDTRLVVERLASLKENLDIPPRPARFDVAHNVVIPERAGRALDVDASAAATARAVVDAARAGAGEVDVDLAFAAVEPKVTRDSLAGLDVSHVIASFATYFSRRGDQGSRATNIEVAASHIDGLVIQPGELVSFNDVVGARIEDNGFQKAYEIFKGEYVEGTGGGTCQVASTLHAIAFFGGLDIVQRLPHSRPSAYIPAGLDATVVYPTVDLKLRNPYAFPLVVHATVSGNKLAMELLGAAKPASVTFGHEVLSTTPFERKVVEEAAVARPRRKQKGADGMELSRWRGIAFRDGRYKLEKSRDMYPPTTEIWQVPPGYDEARLPPLGEDFPKPDKPDQPDKPADAPRI
jgi:vancomycin resistance protein YoaR